MVFTDFSSPHSLSVPLILRKGSKPAAPKTAKNMKFGLQMFQFIAVIHLFFDCSKKRAMIAMVTV